MNVGSESDAVLNELRSLGDVEAVKGMARYGIRADKAYGVSIPKLRGLAKRIGKDHELAKGLWKTGVHEARILAGMIAQPDILTEREIEEWVEDFDSWDLCDQVCMNLFEKTGVAYEKALKWSLRDEEFVKRAGFVLMARQAVSDKKAEDEKFERFFPAIVRESVDERNFVKKAVNWALRQIGKRNRRLNLKAVEVAKEIQGLDSRSARWIAADAIRELESEAVKVRLGLR